MAVQGKRIDQLDPAAALSGTDLFEIAQLSGTFLSKRTNLNDIATFVNSLVSLGWVKTTYGASSSTWLNLGSQTTYGAVTVVYMGTQGSERVSGEFIVVHDGTNAKVSDGSKLSIPSKLDISIKEARLDTGQIQVKITVGSAGDLDLVYRLADQKPIAP